MKTTATAYGFLLAAVAALAIGAAQLASQFIALLPTELPW